MVEPKILSLPKFSQYFGVIKRAREILFWWEAYEIYGILYSGMNTDMANVHVDCHRLDKFDQSVTSRSQTPKRELR